MKMLMVYFKEERSQELLTVSLRKVNKTRTKVVHKNIIQDCNYVTRF